MGSPAPRRPNIRTHQPPLPQDFVTRDRLAAREIRAPGVTLVVGPAGFGKTVLLTDLAARSPYPVAWLSVGLGDVEPERFVEHAIMAIREVAPGFGESTLAQMRSVFDPALVAERFADDLLALPQPILLILDDLQAATDPAVAKMLGNVIRWQPPTLHLAMGSRVEPRIPLGRARALGQVTDIGPDDLRFTRQETASFLAGQPLPAGGGDLAERVWDLTGGWPIALRMHAIALRDQHVAEARGFQPLSMGRSLQEFLVDEVLDHEPDADREAMLRIALPDVVDVDLCARLCGMDEPSAAALLDRLAYSDRLLSPGDDGTFAYHALMRRSFRDRLQARVGSAEVAALHRLLGAALEERGEVLAAAGHYLEGGDDRAAVALVEASVPRVLLRGEAALAEQWLATLPEHLSLGSPALLLARAAVLSLQGNEAASEESLRRAEAALDGCEDPAARRWFASAIAALDAENFRWLGDLDAGVEAMRDAVEGLGADRSVYHMMAVSMEAAMLKMGSRPEAAIAALRAGEAPPGSAPDAMTARLAMHRALMELGRGRPDLAILAAQTSARDAAALGIEGVWAGAQAWIGIGHLLRLDLDAAVEALPNAVANRSRVGMFHDRESTLAWAMLLHLRQRGDEAVDAVRRFIAETAGETDRRWQGDALSFLARLAIMSGDAVSARRWLTRRDEIEPAVPLHLMENPALTDIHYGLTAGRSEGEQAMDALAALIPVLDQAMNPVDAIRARLLLAIGRKGGRFAPLELTAPIIEAIEIAAPGGILLPFAEFQAPLGRLLRESGRGGARIDAEITAILQGEAPHGAFAGNHLTPREYQVLLALRDGLSNKEIAAKLSISLVTVKRHTVSLYRKLGVEGRVAAVRVARSRGLLEA